MTDSSQLLELLFQIISSLPSAVFGIYPDGSVFLWSQGTKNLTGIASPEALGKNFEKLLKLPTDTKKSLLINLLNTTKPVSYEFNTQADNRGHTLALTLTPLFNRKGKFIGAVGELKDISSEKHLEELKIDFISMVGHELRTPVSIVKGYLDTVIKQAQNLSPELLEYLKRAYTANERQNQTIETLFASSQLEEGTLKIKTEKIKLLPLINGVINEFSDEAQTRGLLLKLIYPHFNVKDVIADPQRVKEVLRNLIGNALKYTRQGEITVSLRENKGKVITSVADTGPGIPPELQPKIFEKFVRGEHTLTEFTQGTGLGLYISRKFVELMGGKIWFETRLDKGTCFYFSLPSAQKHQ